MKKKIKSCTISNYLIAGHVKWIFKKFGNVLNVSEKVYQLIKRIHGGKPNPINEK